MITELESRRLYCKEVTCPLGMNRNCQQLTIGYEAMSLLAASHRPAVAFRIPLGQV